MAPAAESQARNQAPRARRLLMLTCAAALLAGCVTAPPRREIAAPPSDWKATEQVERDAGRGESWTYVDRQADFARYKRFRIEPTVIYQGPESRFDGMDEADLKKFAAYFDAALKTELGKSFQLVEDAAAPDVLKVRVTLFGAEKTLPLVATASKLSILGAVATTLKSVSGQEGQYTGSVLHAVELTDGQTGALKVAALRRTAPDALDLGASLSTDQTVRSVASTVASKLRESFVNMQRAE